VKAAVAVASRETRRPPSTTHTDRLFLPSLLISLGGINDISFPKQADGNADLGEASAFSRGVAVRYTAERENRSTQSLSERPQAEACDYKNRPDSGL
jgi:hypothetical protein